MSRLHDWLTIVARIAPLVLSLIPGIPTAIAPFVAVAIAQAEQLPGATGPQKLQAAVQITRNGIGGLNAAAGHEVIDPLVDDAIAHAVSATVDVANLLQQKTAAPRPAP